MPSNSNTISFTNRYGKTITVTGREKGKATLTFPGRHGRAIKLSGTTARKIAHALLAVTS